MRVYCSPDAPWLAFSALVSSSGLEAGADRNRDGLDCNCAYLLAMGKTIRGTFQSLGDNRILPPGEDHLRGHFFLCCGPVRRSCCWSVYLHRVSFTLDIGCASQLRNHFPRTTRRRSGVGIRVHDLIFVNDSSIGVFQQQEACAVHWHVRGVSSGSLYHVRSPTVGNEHESCTEFRICSASTRVERLVDLLYGAASWDVSRDCNLHKAGRCRQCEVRQVKPWSQRKMHFPMRLPSIGFGI